MNFQPLPKDFNDFCNRHDIFITLEYDGLLKVIDGRCGSTYYIPEGLTLEQFERVRQQYKSQYNEGVEAGKKQVREILKSALGIDESIQEHVDTYHPYPRTIAHS